MKMNFVFAFQIVPSAAGPMVTLIDRARLHHLSLQVRRVLMDQPDGKMVAVEFLRKFWLLYQQMLDLSELEKDLSNVVKVHNYYVSFWIMCIVILQKDCLLVVNRWHIVS